MQLERKKQLHLDNQLCVTILKKNNNQIIMEKDLAQEAISSALSGDWKKALALNKQILKENKKDIDALNRLSRAYAELGDLNKARTTASKVLKIDPFNTIAKKALEKWKGLKKGETYKSKAPSAQTFLEEPGKTKIVSLLHLGSPKVLAKLDAGDEVELNSRPHRVSVITNDAKYVGRLSDDLSSRLRKLIKYGNEYQVYIKSIDKNDVKVFIREVRRSKKLADIPSFSTEKIHYVSFTPPELVHKKESPQDLESEEED